MQYRAIDDFRKKSFFALLITAFCGALFVTIFTLVAVTEIDMQGLYYDELHQAAPAFAYTGKAAGMFAPVVIGGYPVMNMPYSGALKTAVYGLYLRWSDNGFTVKSWRLFGIIISASGIFLFFILSYKLPLLWQLIFGWFLVTDCTFLLASRHDWGPVALAMFFRLLLMGVWISWVTGRGKCAWKPFVMGFIAGIAVFEKLSSVVVLPALCFMMISGEKKCAMRRFVACGFGLLAGFIPLLFVNAYILFSEDTLLFMTHVENQRMLSFQMFFRYLFDFYSLGSGAVARQFILSDQTRLTDSVEPVLLIGLMTVIIITIIRHRGKNRFASLSGVMLACYLSVTAGVYLLPAKTWVHHWILGTPFQYAMISFGILALFSSLKTRKMADRALTLSGVILLTALTLARTDGLTHLKDVLKRGSASPAWDRSFTDLGHFAAAHGEESIFFAADWGLATQVYCLSNGDSELIFEVFWNSSDTAKQDFANLLDSKQKNILYVLTRKEKPLFPNNTARVMVAIEALQGWTETEVDDEIRHLRAINVRKFVRDSPRFLTGIHRKCMQLTP